jgi:peptidyl-prolyl cis-trans isomerase SurA
MECARGCDLSQSAGHILKESTLPSRYRSARQARELFPQPDTRPHTSLHTSRLAIRKLSAACLVAIPLVLTTGCNRTHAPDVLATVNGKPILKPDVEKLYLSNLGDSPHQDQSAEQADIVRLQILRQLEDEEMLQQRAAKLNLVATDEEVEAKLSEMKAPYTQEEFDQRLKSKSLTVDDLRRDLRRNLTTEKLLNKEINSKINITDNDITSFFNEHKSEFNLIEPVYRLSQIVVTTTPAQQAGNLQNSKAANDTEAKKKIEMLRSRLQVGEDFGALATNFSEDPNTSSSGGDMGQLPESTLKQRPDVFVAISRLKPGQVTDVLPLTDPASKKIAAYVIFKLMDRQAAGQRDLKDPRVQQYIRQQLRDSRSQLLKNAYYEMLRDQSKVENYFAEGIFKKGAQ